MRLKLQFAIPLAGAAAAALAITIAPTASANPTCDGTSPGTTVCSKPGHTAISSKPPIVTPHYPYPYGMDYLYGNGRSYNVGGIFRRR